MGVRCEAAPGVGRGSVDSSIGPESGVRIAPCCMLLILHLLLYVFPPNSLVNYVYDVKLELQMAPAQHTWSVEALVHPDALHRT